jgi:hypothetical protein
MDDRALHHLGLGTGVLTPAAEGDVGIGHLRSSVGVLLVHPFLGDVLDLFDLVGAEVVGSPDDDYQISPGGHVTFPGG